MIVADINSQPRAVAIEFTAVRDTNRKMHWLLLRQVSLSTLM